MSITNKLIILGVVFILVGGSFWLYGPALFSNIQNQKPHLGSEIKNYPLDGLSFTVTNWTFATVEAVNKAGIFGVYFTQSELQNGTVYVVVNFTFRNIADTEININGFDTFYKLSGVTSPLLKYGNYYAQANPSKFYTGYGLYSDQSRDLMPNQTTNGALVYETLEGYTPNSLIYPNKDSNICN